jgi:hypothetical protein
MDWGTLAGTALGALLGAGSTMTADRTRWKREHFTRERSTRRELYGLYLKSLSLATHQLRDLRRSGLPHDERMRTAGEILSTSGAYESRYQMLITAPDALEEPVEQAFNCLRNLRDLLEEPDPCADQVWERVVTTIGDAIDILKKAMREDLSESA